MQKVLDYRQQLEEDAKVRLGRAEQNLNEARGRRDRIRAELERAQDRLYSDEVLQAGDYWLLEQYVKGLTTDLASAEMQVRMLAQMVEEARKFLADRAIERKVLEKLKERHKYAYIREEQGKEQRFNDEIATIRFKAAPV